MKKHAVLSAMLAVMMLASCSGERGSVPSQADVSTASVSVTSFELPAEAKKSEAETKGTLIDLENVSAEGVTVNNGTVTVTASGTYTVTGTLSGGLCIDTADEKKVTLYLNGVQITNASGAALAVLSCPKKAEIITESGSVNLLVGGSDEQDAALYSEEDLRFSGEGELYVSSETHRGIHSKDDIEIEGGSLFVSAADDGILGKDSVTVSGGSISITAGGNGVRSSGDEEDSAADKGVITVSGGTLSVTSEGDALDAAVSLTVSDGEIAVCSGGGAENAPAHEGEGFGGGGGGGGFNPGGRGGGGGGFRGFAATTATTATTEDSTSGKGLKAGETLTVSGGTLDINSADDTLHCHTTLTVSGGSLRLQSGDDGLHCDDTLTVSGGTVEILTSYEGIEADILTISGGNINITASDDGLNAGIKTVDMGGPGGFGGRSTSSSSSNNGLFITGGTVTVNAAGDGLDSNSSVNMTGGFVTVFGPTDNGNGPLDYGGTFTFSGGTVVAVGSSGMAQSVTNKSAGGVIFTRLSATADSTVTVADESGNEVLSLTIPKKIECIVFASDTLKAGESYTLSVNGSKKSTAAAS